jgi:hypothetical protein
VGAAWWRLPRGTDLARTGMPAFAQTPVLPEATPIGAYRPIEASRVATCYARDTSIRAVRLLATNVRSGSGRRARGIISSRLMGLLSTMTIERRQPALARHRDVMTFREARLRATGRDVDQGIHLRHPVTAHSHCSSDLLLKATCGVSLRSYRLVSGNGGNQDSRRTIQLS